MRYEGRERAYSLRASFHVFCPRPWRKAPKCRSRRRGCRRRPAVAHSLRRALQLAVLKFNQRGSWSSDEKRISTSLALAGSGSQTQPGESWPGPTCQEKVDAMGRVPRQHFAPVSHFAFDVALVPPSPDARLDEDGFKWGLGRVVRCRPPSLHLFDKDAERAIMGACTRTLLRTTASSAVFGIFLSRGFGFCCRLKCSHCVSPHLIEVGAQGAPLLRDSTGRSRRVPALLSITSPASLARADAARLRAADRIMLAISLTATGPAASFWKIAMRVASPKASSPACR